MGGSWVTLPYRTVIQWEDGSVQERRRSQDIAPRTSVRIGGLCAKYADYTNLCKIWIQYWEN
jgi:hypothetical protein